MEVVKNVNGHDIIAIFIIITCIHCHGARECFLFTTCSGVFDHNPPSLP